MPVTASLIIAGVGVATKGAQAIGSEIRAGKLRRAARKLGDAPYSATPQLLGYYDQALQESVAPRGLSQESIGAANQGIAAMTTGNIRNAQRLGGGNISSQINASLNNANVDAATRLAERDAAMRYQNRMSAFGRLGSATNTLQGINNMNTNLKLEKIRALGKAASDARMSANYALGDLGNSLISAGAMGLNGGFGEGTPTMPTGGNSLYLGNPPVQGATGLGYYDETMTGAPSFRRSTTTRRPNYSSFYSE